MEEPEFVLVASTISASVFCTCILVLPFHDYHAEGAKRTMSVSVIARISASWLSVCIHVLPY